MLSQELVPSDNKYFLVVALVYSSLYFFLNISITCIFLIYTTYIGLISYNLNIGQFRVIVCNYIKVFTYKLFLISFLFRNLLRNNNIFKKTEVVTAKCDVQEVTEYETYALAPYIHINYINYLLFLH